MSPVEQQPARGMLRDPWTRLGLAGAALALSVPLVHVPASLWAGNLAEFHSAFVAFFGLGLIGVGVGLAIVLGLFRLLPRPARAALASLFCAIGVIWWVYAYFLVGRMVVLNGADAPVDFNTRLGAWETPVVAVLCVLLAIGIGRARRLSTLIVGIFNAGLLAATLVTLLTAGRTPLRGVATDLSGAFQFSPDANVFVLLLDGLQSDVTDEILRSDPALAAAFDGFELYKDTMGVAPTTFLSLPAIHSGAVYDGAGSIPAYFSGAIAHNSFMSRFADAGYRTLLVDAVADVCPDRIAGCLSGGDLVRTRAARLTLEGIRLLDLSLFRISPVDVKRRLYDNGNWFVGRVFLGTSFEVNRIFEGHAVLNELGRRLSMDSAAPTLKFVHLFMTHVPFVMKTDCQSLAPEHSFDYLLPQSRCGLKSVAALLDHFKQNGLYDQTVILILADHGIGRDSHYNPYREFDTAEWASMAGAANPTFLLKRRNQHGALREAAGEVHLADVGATLCAASGACTGAPGYVAGQAPADRARRFNQYVWKHEFWNTHDIPDISPFEVHGPVWDAESWRPATPIAAYRLGDGIALSAPDKSDRYLQAGWGAAESWGRWTSSRVAQMALRLDAPVDGALDIVARVWALVPPHSATQNATWLVNGQEIGTWTFEPGNTLAERRLQIPRSIVAGSRDLLLDLRISRPTSPTPDEPRHLGLAFATLALVPAHAAAAVEPPPVTESTSLPD
jgi:hypothetical protein